jgi:NAD(P)-dependent dehydrogenase (short-subunit alcohol dehydrogenase family)
MQLANKVCLIAGASGALGHSIAQLFFSEGARLCLTSHSQPPVIEGFASERVLARSLDVRNKSEVDAVVDQSAEHFGTIDVLVNCTGTLGPVGPTSEIAAVDWVKTIEINLIGSFYLTQAVLPFMVRKGCGKIIHFSGGGAAYGRPHFTAYGASKAALVRFVESLAGELSDAHIDVNAIAPGSVNSRMWDELRAVLHKAGPGALEDIRKMDQTGGVSPALAAKLAAFLASDASNGLSGKLISAVHDSWQTFADRIPQIASSESGTLRRISFA